MALAELQDLSDAMDIAVKVDFGACDPRDRRIALPLVDRLRSQLAAVEGSLVGAYDAHKDWAGYGHRSAAVGVRETAKVPDSEARRAVAWGRALRTMPLVREALVDGAISSAHAMRLRPCAKRPEFADAEAFLVEQAGVLRWADWLKAVAYWEQVLDDQNDNDDGFDVEADLPAGEFYASLTLDGVGVLNGSLTKTAFEAFEESLHRIERELFAADWKRLVDKRGLQATIDQMPAAADRRARALVEMAYRAATAPKDGKRPLPLVVVHTDVDTLERASARVLGIDAPEPLGTTPMCELDSGVVISADDMMRLALHGTVRRLVYTSKSHVLDYGHEVRLYTGALRQAIIHAARTCEAEGCETRASRSEIDHRHPHKHGGHTNAANGRPLCQPDHRHRTKTDPG